MHIIRTFKDIEKLKINHAINNDLANYLEEELKQLKESYEPEVPQEDFSLDIYGPIAILDSGEESLTSLGLPQSIRNTMPEWVSIKHIGEDSYFVIYILADNDFINQIYLPSNGVSPALFKWLSEQAESEQTDEDYPEKTPF
jgi:hypothetical protein